MELIGLVIYSNEWIAINENEYTTTLRFVLMVFK